MTTPTPCLAPADCGEAEVSKTDGRKTVTGGVDLKKSQSYPRGFGRAVAKWRGACHAAHLAHANALCATLQKQTPEKLLKPNSDPWKDPGWASSPAPGGQECAGVAAAAVDGMDGLARSHFGSR